MTNLKSDGVIIVTQDGTNYKIDIENLKSAIAPAAQQTDGLRTAGVRGTVVPGRDMIYDAKTGEINPKTVKTALTFRGSVGNSANDKTAPDDDLNVGDYYVLSTDFYFAVESWGNIYEEEHTKGSYLIVVAVDESDIATYSVIEDGLGGSSVVSIQSATEALIVSGADPAVPILTIETSESSNALGKSGKDGLMSKTQARTLVENTAQIITLGREIRVVQEEINAIQRSVTQGEWYYSDPRTLVEEGFSEPGEGHFYFINDEDGVPDNWDEIVEIVLSTKDLNGKDHAFTEWNEGDTLELIAEQDEEGGGDIYGLFTLGTKVADKANHISVTLIRSAGVLAEDEERRYFVNIFAKNEDGGDLTIETGDQRYLKTIGDLNKPVEGNLQQINPPEVPNDLVNKAYTDSTFMKNEGSTVKLGDFKVEIDDQSRFVVTSTSVNAYAADGTYSKPISDAGILTRGWFDENKAGISNLVLNQGATWKNGSTTMLKINTESTGAMIDISNGKTFRLKTDGVDGKTYINLSRQGEFTIENLRNLSSNDSSTKAANKKYVDDQVGKVASSSKSGGYLFNVGDELFFRG